MKRTLIGTLPFGFLATGIGEVQAQAPDTPAMVVVPKGAEEVWELEGKRRAARMPPSRPDLTRGLQTGCFGFAQWTRVTTCNVATDIDRQQVAEASSLIATSQGLRSSPGHERSAACLEARNFPRGTHTRKSAPRS